jgi:integrase/recombinase XerD
MTGNILLAPFVRSFFEDHLVCRRNVSPNTVKSYRDALKLFLEFATRQRGRSAAHMAVVEVTETMVISFLADLEQTRSNAIKTRNHRLVALRNLLEYIAAREPLLVEHCRRLAAIPSKRGAVLPEIRYLERDEAAALLKAPDQKTAMGRRDGTLLLFMYNTGARVQEVADCRIGWLSLDSPGKVELLGKGHKWRTCPLWASTAQDLRTLITERKRPSAPDDHVFLNRFGQPLSRSGIADIIGRYAERAASGMPSLASRRITPHVLRHTTAMHLLQSGVEVNVIRSWLGHVSIATTSRYIEIDLAMKAKALEACEVPKTRPKAAPWRTDPDIIAWLESL